MLFALLPWVDQRVMSVVPQGRASIEEAVETAERIRKVLRSEIDPGAFERLVSKVFRDHRLDLTAPSDARTPLLIVGPDADWVQWNRESQVKLRSAMRRIVLTLVESVALAEPRLLACIALG